MEEVLATCGFNTHVEKEKLDPVKNKPIINIDTGEIEKIKIPVNANRFKVVHVFNISQTTGEPVLNLIDKFFVDKFT